MTAVQPRPWSRELDAHSVQQPAQVPAALLRAISLPGIVYSRAAASVMIELLIFGCFLSVADSVLRMLSTCTRDGRNECLHSAYSVSVPEMTYFVSSET